MPADASLLFIIGGGDDADRVTQTGSKITVTGTTDLTKLLLDRVPHHRLHVTRNYFRQGRQADLTGYRTLVNLITEPEQNSKVLENLRKLLRGLPGRVVNPPEAVLRTSRDLVAKRLAGTPGLVVPTTVRLQGGKPAVAARTLEQARAIPPLIVRQVGTHGGKILGCFDSSDKAIAELETGDNVATEFVDFQSADGLYRKYRVFFIGPRIVFRHMLISDEWNVHAKDRTRFMAERPKLVAEERALFEAAGDPFPANVMATLRMVRDRMGLDFFGMDFGVTRDGPVVLFEANATMSFFPFAPDPQFEYLRASFAPAQAAFRELLDLPPEVAPVARGWLEA